MSRGTPAVYLSDSGNCKSRKGVLILLDADAESEAERDDKDVAWKSLRRHLIQQMLEKDLDVMSF